MAKLFILLGKVAGRAVRSHAFDRAFTVAARYVYAEMRHVDLRAKLSLLRRKHKNHLRLLGKTIYRLSSNDIAPTGHESVNRIVSVLDEIRAEIAFVEDELARRKQEEQSGNRPPNTP